MVPLPFQKLCTKSLFKGENMDLVSQHIWMQIGYKWSHKAALIPY